MQLRKLFTIGLLAFATLVFAACGMAEPMNKPADNMGKETSNMSTMSNAQYHKISPELAKERMEKNPKAIILDVRTEGEYKDGHIKNAILVPNETINTTPPKELPNKDAEILVYCRSGNRSRQAAEKLVKMGYTNVHDFGGVNTWSYGLVK